ncbi:probable glucosamine 6-phosphate N-acetyltransferase 2 [Dendrobium catenatum]|uniref:Glucosamine 6-phosphate N-acetyltransferase n=1 Tax=Dendrobium catenatum TaxID=906689 RepID=A0A2I0VYP6_9ASPA|nr:probable glucosamine 6-phosphate N-acetyltransferase 2 [Dendrobium catenatum]XP_020691628.1 probable glucosamine 6-phosphate N-acetyltransferase 2 [Dendrobium catenatum]XP_020691635.1 probable glucosamine 6-phosphate N-acetyltransferase 2 [Dendrobium catenatum]XP_020691662.1 probable glucosamine 6-phosphate N-acetyltransferase 2 [Dendrobium catenatum]XP_020691678.1 probable glucosamine 6-phosphate N-acetyltransferase 2 [Dendrobium catenatum]XP_028555198.1 probable glucosamine 6-phosphate N-
MDSEASNDTRTGDTDPYTDDLLPIRYLEISDHAKGFVELLGQLSPCPPISVAEFCSRFAELAALGDDHIICVIEDPKTSRIVATGSVFVEKKFLRGCGKVGHIEDVVVDGAARCRRLGQRVVRFLAEHARVAGCYKVILDCTSELRGFYEKCGFVEKNVQMAMYFQD